MNETIQNKIKELNDNIQKTQTEKEKPLIKSIEYQKCEHKEKSYRIWIAELNTYLKSPKTKKELQNIVKTKEILLTSLQKESKQYDSDKLQSQLGQICRLEAEIETLIWLIATLV